MAGPIPFQFSLTDIAKSQASGPQSVSAPFSVGRGAGIGLNPILLIGGALAFLFISKKVSK